jgi:hypothetical protein
MAPVGWKIMATWCSVHTCCANPPSNYVSTDICALLTALAGVVRSANLGPDHGSPLRNPAQRLAQVPAAANERHRVVVLVDVVHLVSRRQYLMVEHQSTRQQHHRVMKLPPFQSGHCVWHLCKVCDC